MLGKNYKQSLPTLIRELWPSPLFLLYGPLQQHLGIRETDVFPKTLPKHVFPHNYKAVLLIFIFIKGSPGFPKLPMKTGLATNS